MSFQIKESKIFLPKEEVDEETLKQINIMVDEPTTNHARFMPDCHKSSGCCVGFTNMIKKGVVPNYVGGDIEKITQEYSLSYFFLIFTLIPIALGFLSLLLHPLLKKLMHGVK